MKRVAILLTILVASILTLLTACDKKPTAPQYDNPFDIENPATGGDPFQLTAQIAGGGITLQWTKPDFEHLQSYKIYRSEQETTGYAERGTANSGQTQYIDKEIENGHSYWYLITAVNSKGQETGRSNTAAVNINTDPVLVINGGAEYTPSREVQLTILATTGRQMLLSNSADFSGANWESYATGKTWTLASGEGQKTVYLKIKYDNEILSKVITANIKPQPMNPSIKILGDTTQYTTARNVKLTLSATGSNLQMKLSEDSTFAGVAWQPYAANPTFQLSEGEGKKKVYVKFKNDFEIESIGVGDEITLDTTPPTIALSVSPDSGITNETYFEFDPTASSDNLALAADLRVRYDYENDGTYDTEWKQLQITNYEFPIGGGDKTVKVQLKDGAGWQVESTAAIFVNTRPQAAFTAEQISFLPPIVHFDASASADYEDGSNLEYRWDFDGDGGWDTAWLTQDTISYEYANDGDFNAKLTVRDRNALMVEQTVQVSVVFSMTDIDGNVYKVVKIGEHWWMAENLKVTKYRNGEAIANVTDNSSWSNLSTGAWCAYGNDNSNIDTYGLLYNWYAVADSRNIAPQGWHVPTDEEFTTLENYLIANGYNWDGTTEGNKIGKSLASQTGWLSSSEAGAVGNDMSTNNASGFTALPGGYRDYGGRFSSIANYGAWWSSTAGSSDGAWRRGLSYYHSDIARNSPYNKQFGYSVRLVRD